MARPKGPWPSKPPRPVEVARQIRATARRLHAPKTVLLICDYFVEFFALNKHFKKPHCRISYGRHSEKERAWDRRRCAQLVEEGLPPRRLVHRPPEPRPGLAELLGMCRRSAIRDGQWLSVHGLVRLHYEQEVDGRTYGGTHPVACRRIGPHAGVEHTIGCGGGLPDGTGLATEWRLIPPHAPAPPSPPEPEPEPPAVPPVTPERMAAIRGAFERSRGP